LELLEKWGARVVLVPAEEHDRMVAATQALTHAAVLAFGLALVELDADVTAHTTLAPPPHATLLALLSRIAGGTPEVYWDVQVANPYAARSRGALASGLRRVAALVDGADEAGFTAALTELRGLFGADLSRCRAACARVFELINDGGEHGRDAAAAG
jgi:prephenate dehydrogenase